MHLLFNLFKGGHVQWCRKSSVAMSSYEEQFQVSKKVSYATSHSRVLYSQVFTVALGKLYEWYYNLTSRIYNRLQAY